MGLWPELRSLPRRDKATQFREKILYEVDLHFIVAYFKTDLTSFWQNWGQFSQYIRDRVTKL